MIDITVTVEGRDKLIAKLLKLKASLRQFNSAFDRLKSTAMQATVKAGGSNKRSHGGGIYVKSQHDGGFARGSYGPHKVGPNPWLERALVQSTPRAIAIIEEEIAIKIKEAGL